MLSSLEKQAMHQVNHYLSISQKAVVTATMKNELLTPNSPPEDIGVVDAFLLEAQVHLKTTMDLVKAIQDNG